MELLFTDPSLTLIVPFELLKSGTRKLLADLCNDGITRFHLSSLATTLETDDLLGWFRLSLYVGDSWNLESFMGYRHFCTKPLPKPIDSSLRQLLASEDFQVQPSFKSVREHIVLREWKKRMQKESFVKLFIRRSSATNKRKLPAADDRPIDENSPERARVSHSDDSEWNNKSKRQRQAAKDIFLFSFNFVRNLCLIQLDVW